MLSQYHCVNPETGFPVFAFRLHQFVSKGDTVHASLESERQRYVTTEKQKYVPDGSRERVLLPLAFCRECGQEYYTVRLVDDAKTGKQRVEPREIDDLFSTEGNEAGFLCVKTDDPWPEEGTAEYAERLPDDWVEERNGVLVICTVQPQEYAPFLNATVLLLENPASHTSAIAKRTDHVRNEFRDNWTLHEGTIVR